jgi:membrane protein
MATKKTLPTDSAKPPSQSVFAVFKTAFKGFGEDNCTVLAAAFAYTAVQSVIPLLLGFVAVGSLFLQDEKTKNDFISGLKTSIPTEVSNAIDLGKIIDDFVSGAGATAIISILLLLWSGSGIFAQLKFGINQTFGIRKDPRNPIFQIGLQLFMLVVLGGLLIASFVVSIIAGLILSAKVELFGISPSNFNFILPFLSYLIPILLEVLIFASLYKLSPARKGIRWRLVLLGGLFTTVLFEILKVFMGIYVTSFGAATNAQKTYGAIGGIFVFLFFLYTTGMVILLGAELTAALHNSKYNPAVKEAQAEAEAALVEAREKIINTEVKPLSKKPTPVATLIGASALVIAAVAGLASSRNSKG